MCRVTCTPYKGNSLEFLYNTMHGLVPCSCQELPVWAVGCGQPEMLGCYWMPELSLHFLQGKTSPWMGSWVSSRSDSCAFSGLQGISWKRQLIVGSETQIPGKLLLNFWLINPINKFEHWPFNCLASMHLCVWKCTKGHQTWEAEVQSLCDVPNLDFQY